MKKVESIWAELSAKAQESTELSEVKVELGMIQDIQKKVDKAEQTWKSAESNIGNILRAADDKVMAEMKPLNEIAFDLRKDMNDFESKADELGLDSGEKNKYVKQIQSALDAIEKRTDYLDQVGKVIRQNF